MLVPGQRVELLLVCHLLKRPWWFAGAEPTGAVPAVQPHRSHGRAEVPHYSHDPPPPAPTHPPTDPCPHSGSPSSVGSLRVGHCWLTSQPPVVCTSWMGRADAPPLPHQHVCSLSSCRVKQDKQGSARWDVLTVFRWHRLITGAGGAGQDVLITGAGEADHG